MSEEDKQAVVDKTDAQAKPAAEGADARETGDDLDKLLNEFDTSTKPKVEAIPAKPAKATGTDDDTKARLENVERQLADKQFQDDIGPVIKTIRGNVPAEVLSDAEIVDLLDGRAKRDPRLRQAWLNRSSNPQAWSKVETALGNELAAKFSKLPDRNATEDREAVAAAVRAGASAKAPEGKAPDFSKMNPQEYRAAVEEKYGYTPNV